MAKKVAMVVGVVFVLVGILGFFNNPILGLFEVNAAHNVVHLLTGLLALGAGAAGVEMAKRYFMVFGVVYALVTVWGFVSEEVLFGLLSVNGWDNLLHLVLAAVFLYVGFMGKQTAPAPATPPPASGQAM